MIGLDKVVARIDEGRELMVMLVTGVNSIAALLEEQLELLEEQNKILRERNSNES